MAFDPGIAVTPSSAPLGFRYGAGVYGPNAEIRRLNDIRKSLRDPRCEGPDAVYAIAMDVGKEKDMQALIARNLLFGVVTYVKGRLGEEPIRSQGHIHAVSPSCGQSTGELYEIWTGRACIYMQERATDDPGRCFAVMADPGDLVLVPPGWAHCTISADSERSLTFGAWCVRDYGFDYTQVRAHGGLAWFPILKQDELAFERNGAYAASPCAVKRPRIYKEFGLAPGVPIYRQFEDDPDRFLFIPRPDTAAALWQNFEP